MTLLVAITGGTASGKTTLAASVLAALPRGAAALMSEDAYYRDCSMFPGFDPATFDFDDVAVRDHPLLIAHLTALKAGRSIATPNYSFVTHKRLPGDGAKVAPAPVVIVEGSHLLCVRDVAAVFDLRVYLDAPDDVRFIRRLLRDQQERGRSQNAVINQYLTTVRPAHLKFTGPSKVRADLVISNDAHGAEQPDRAVMADLADQVVRHPALQRALNDML